MPSSNPTTNDDDASPDPATPRKATARRASNPAITPKSNPAAAPGPHVRLTPKRPEPPTLLADFFLGRPSPARIAAERQRRRSIEAVKAELRHEMKQSAIKKVQPPGGVKDRVKAWQKANATAGVAVVDDAATEPTEVAFKEDDANSVTESDRVRIKLRQKKKSISRATPPIVIHKATQDASDQNDATADNVEAKPPPKRVVSDEHWRKTRGGRRSPPRKVSPRAKKSASPSPGPLPKDFVIRSGPNPTVSSKIKNWAEKVEIPDTPPPRSYRSSKSRERSARFEDKDNASDAPSSTADSASQATATQSRKTQSAYDDGIRVTPTRKKLIDDDGIRVSAVSSSANDDDGIRVRPVSALAPTKTDTKISFRESRPRSKTTTEPRQSKSSEPPRASQYDSSQLSRRTGDSEDRGSTTEPRHAKSERFKSLEDYASQLSQKRADSEDRGSSKDEVDEEQSVPDTPTKRPGPRRRSGGKPRPKSFHAPSTKISGNSTWISDEDSNLGSEIRPESDLTSSLAAKSVADIAGDIPFGHSAFSELDLPLNGAARSRPKRTKVERTTSLKAMPSVFKKVVEEGKKIIQDMNESPKQPIANKPPSIEKWLNGTVDPFVEPSAPENAPAPKPKVVEKEWAEETKSRRRSSQEVKPLRVSTLKKDTAEDEENTAPEAETSEAKTETVSPKESPKEIKSPPSSSLKRSQATRNSSSWKTRGKLPFLGVLKEAFKGESSEHTHPLNNYQGRENRQVEEEYDSVDDQTVSSSGVSSLTDGDSSVMDAPPKMAGPRFRPPTNGHHELSTIMSEEGSSAIESDMSSDLSHSTLTQSTILTKDSELSRSQNAGSGLKRRLTKHSDLVSVLSLPDDSNIPRAIKSNRSRPSLRKNRGASDDVTVEDLLREFVEDENLYMRELKTLVDGVVPVLLSQVVGGLNPTELFGTRPVVDKADVVSKSVVSMGVSLEKLKNAHKKAPSSDLRRLAHWAHGVVPIYNSYLSAWRLGFQDLVVNLAPAAEGPDDEDSLLDALPRNESGDVLNADGERVDVAHLLKRPLLRVKQMTKFIRCMDSIIATNDTNDLLRDFENLQEKARRRHREETARMADDDATNTDTTRSRDLRTLEAKEAVTIDPSRQVSAKDIFSLDLAHSNGQRLECQVELVHRDNQSNPEDEGDLLIREVGDGRRSYLLFPPLAMSTLSARTGEGNFDMVLMTRGNHRSRQWHELLTLSADNEDQILDWLDILPLNPVPPREPEGSVIGDLDDLPSQKRRSDIPVGARTIRSDSPSSPNVEVIAPDGPYTPTKRPLPSRYHPRATSQPTTPTRGPASPDSQGSDRTPTQDDYDAGREESSRPLSEGMRPDPRNLKGDALDSALYREDGAPPPPVHRTLSPTPQPKSKSKPSLKPASESKKSSRVRRRTSSPLKHEYLPSDVSSSSETSLTERSEDDSEDSSDDEIESVDIPETELGVSIQKIEPLSDERLPEERLPAEDSPVESLLSEPEDMTPPPVVDSMVSASECSLTPSNSASQAGMHGHKTAPNESAARFMASISRWSEKGSWRDISGTPCSIVVTAGLIEAYTMANFASKADTRPLLAMDLTPLVLIRQSTVVDLEIRSTVQPHCQLSKTHGGGNFRFRCHSAPECFTLYMSVHHARLNNQKFIQLENEARFKSFGEKQPHPDNDGDTSSRRRSWFGRKNSYRSSVRAPTQSQDGASTTPSSSLSASSFLKRLTVGGNLSFNIARSSVDRQSRGGSGGNSLYTSGSSSSGTPPRSPSISVGNSSRNPTSMNSTESIRIRLHLLAAAAKWEDYGNCSLQIRRPPPGWHQALRADHGLEKRVTVTTMPKKSTEEPRIVLDAVLGSGCFTPMGNRGIVCGIWEDAKPIDGTDGIIGFVPATGPTGGNIKKWCFQFGGAPEANWVLRMVHQEVLRA